MGNSRKKSEVEESLAGYAGGMIYNNYYDAPTSVSVSHWKPEGEKAALSNSLNNIGDADLDGELENLLGSALAKSIRYLKGD